MTRKEALERIKIILEECIEDEDAVSYVTSYDADALDMAIKALKQEPCEDCISRQAAIDVLRTCYDTETVTYTNGNEYIDYDQALDLLNSLPSAQPERMRGTWIDYVNSHCECSVCHTEWSYFQNETECFEFCPHCGADMRGEQDDSF